MNEKINFFTEKSNYRIPHKKAIRIWIKRAIKKEKFRIGDINIIICDDYFLYNLNKKFLKKSTLTDIITFPLNETGNIISGDIFISHPRVKENAKQYKIPLFHELARVIIHGILHLTGNSDENNEGKKRMRMKENEHLATLEY